MPIAPPRACATCGRPGCQDHARSTAWHHATPVRRIRGRRLQRLRRQLFDRQPLCVACEKNGRVEIATIRDHVIPLEEGGLDIEANVQPLCQSCSDRKTQAEAQRGSIARHTGGW